MLVSWDQEEIVPRIKARRSVLCSIPHKDISRSSETISIIEELSLDQSSYFLKEVQNISPESWKIIWGSIPSEDEFCNSDNKHDRNDDKAKFVYFEEEIIETNAHYRKLSMVRVLTGKFIQLQNHAQDKKGTKDNFVHFMRQTEYTWHDAGKTMPRVATPTQNKPSKETILEAIRHDLDKRTNNVETPIVHRRH